MPNLIQKLFTHSETFRRLHPDLFLAWLKRSEGYLTNRGLVIPADCGGFVRDAFNPDFDYDGLVRVFMEPTADIAVKAARQATIPRKRQELRVQHTMAESHR